jgi:hypothetical protein
LKRFDRKPFQKRLERKPRASGVIMRRNAILFKKETRPKNKSTARLPSGQKARHRKSIPKKSLFRQQFE